MPKLKLFILLIVFVRIAPAIDVAITVDDLPVHGNIPANTNRLTIAKTMLATLKKHHITGVYGFINGYTVTNQGTQDVLKAWVNSGQLLGNHTYSHMNLTTNTANHYINDIKQNEPILQGLMHKKDYKYFRYPYLREGNTKNKRDAVRGFLFQNNYKIAEVTLDFWDYEWNNPYARCMNRHDQKSTQYLKDSYLKAGVGAITAARSLSQLLFKRDIKYILLLHIGALDAQMLDNLLTQYEKFGVKFISLQEALNDRAYSIDSQVVRDTGYTFLNEIRVSRKLQNPAMVKQFYDSIPENTLDAICK